MPKYIEKGQILLGKFTVPQESEYARGWNDGLEAVAENAPAADVVPVVRGMSFIFIMFSLANSVALSAI